MSDFPMENQDIVDTDGRTFRHALGAFATGVTVVTTVDDTGKAIAMTANSFSSVSLDPPLVLWSVGDHADGYQCFIEAERFCVHVLHSKQVDISNHFAKKSADKFKGIDWEMSKYGLPLLRDFAARFECVKEASYPGGDHVILVGRVLQYEDRADKDPLIFHRGLYKNCA